MALIGGDDVVAAWPGERTSPAAHRRACSPARRAEWGAVLIARRS